MATWSRTPITERRALLTRIADALAERTDEFARLLTQEQGKPIAMAQREIKGAVALMPRSICRSRCDIADDSRLVREEQFGPVLPVIRYSDVDDAIRRINSTGHGLGASVWSSNLNRALAVADQIVAGTVWVNKHLDIPPDVPFGGARQSGFGVEMGQDGLREFTQPRIINLAR